MNHPLQPIQTANDLHDLALSKAESGQLEDAISHMQQALQLASHEPIYHLHLSAMMKAYGQPEAAKQLLLKLIGDFPHYAPAHHNLGNLYYREEKWLLAISAYESALVLQADYIDAYYHLGLALTKAGQRARAQQVYLSLLALDNHHPGARFQLACLFMQINAWQPAIEQWLILYQAHPHHLETVVNLASSYLKIHDLNNALHYYLLAYELAPYDTQVLFNLGVLTEQLGLLSQAIDHYKALLAINPSYSEAHHNLAVIYLNLHQNEQAIAHFSAVIQMQPDNVSVRYSLEALTQKSQLDQAPLTYVRTLFDAYAVRYDAHMQQDLQCTVPQLLFDAVQATQKSISQKNAILDLGCGTGACGQYFRPIARQLIGVDISEKMLAVAAHKKIYDTLYCQSITDFLRQTIAQYHIIIAGDVLVYFGDLEELFALIYARLQWGGLFIFTTESSAEMNWALQKSGRFAHNQHYLAQVANKFKFKQMTSEEKIIRGIESDRVNGHITLWQKR